MEWLPPVCWGVVCEDFHCGEPWSRLDADGCARPECVTDADCAADRHCNPRYLAGSCFQSLGCADEDGTCSCGGNLGCNLDPRGYCLDRDDFPPADLCAATHVPCEELPNWIGNTAASISDSGDELVPELAARVAECQGVRVERAVDECGVSVCEMVCVIAGSVCGGRNCEELCAAAEPADALAFAELLATSPTTCADCPSCEASGNPLCAVIGPCQV